VYEHAQKVEQRRADEPAADVVAELRAEDQRLQEVIAGLKREAENHTVLDKEKQRQFVATGFAMGVSLRPVEDLFGVLLPQGQVPDHSTLGRWVADEARRAGAVLAVIDPACTPRIETLAIDAIFLGGGPPWSGSSPRA
jgi:hypothetical protein